MTEHWQPPSHSVTSPTLLARANVVGRMSGSRLELARQQQRLQEVDIPKPENLDGRDAA